MPELLLIKRTIAELRQALIVQANLGVYNPTPRELPPLTWVWASVYSQETGYQRLRVLGVILDIRKWRYQGDMQREYTVLTTKGQFACPRERLVLATMDEVRAEEGLTATQDLKEAIYSAIENGPSEANTLRYVAAATALLDLNQRFVRVPATRGEKCDCSICLKVVDVMIIPRVVREGSWR